MSETNEVGVLVALVAALAYLVGFATGRKAGVKEQAAKTQKWLDEIKVHVDRGEALLVHMKRYVQEQHIWTFVSLDETPPSKDRMH